jgi:hypothetical protein
MGLEKRSIALNHSLNTLSFPRFHISIPFIDENTQITSPEKYSIPIPFISNPIPINQEKSIGNLLQINRLFVRFRKYNKDRKAIKFPATYILVLQA